MAREFTQLSRGRHLFVTIALQLRGVETTNRLNRTKKRCRKHFALIAIIAACAMAGPTLRAQDAGALLDLLVKKHLITDQEAEEVRGDLTREAATTAAGKWKISAPITEIELYGEARMRYEVRTAEAGM